jgi:hypothetical protein
MTEQAEIRIKRNSPEYIKMYYEKNKETIKKNVAQYYTEHKENIINRNLDIYKRKREELLEKIPCSCGCMVAKCHLLRHNKTKRHINRIN